MRERVIKACKRCVSVNLRELELSLCQSERNKKKDWRQLRPSAKLVTWLVTT